MPKDADSGAPFGLHASILNVGERRWSARSSPARAKFSAFETREAFGVRVLQQRFSFTTKEQGTNREARERQKRAVCHPQQWESLPALFHDWKSSTCKVAAGRRPARRALSRFVR